MPSFPPLPSNRLILNGHKINSSSELLSYLNKRLKTSLFSSLVDFKLLAQHYSGLTIAIRHSDTFLANETPKDREHIILLLSQQGLLNISGKQHL